MKPEEATRAIAQHVVHTAETVAGLHARSEQSVTRHQRVIERVTATIGRPGAVYAALVAILVWVIVNAAEHAAGRAAIDPPPFGWLATFTSVAALLTTMVILTSHNRQARNGEQRAHLDLQVNLLAEQKAAKIIELLEELRRDLPIVRDRVDPIAEAMQETVDPAKVMQVFEQTVEGTSADTNADETTRR